MVDIGHIEVIPKEKEKFGLFLDLCEEYFRESFPDVLTPEWPGDYASLLERRYRDGGRRFLICTVRGEPAGFANIYVEGATGFIAEFYVRPAFRRKRVGSALFETCRGLLAEMGAGNIEIGVQIDWPGRVTFWNSLGFKAFRLRMKRKA